MDIGKLKSRVIIEQDTSSQDAAGGVTHSWSTFATVWARIEPLTGRLLFQAQQANSEAQGVVHIRYLPGILPTMRVKYGTRALQILSVLDPNEAREELQLLYKEALD